MEDICDQCQSEAVLFCEECRNSYCAKCSLVRHRVGKKQTHSTVRISKVANITHIYLEEDALSQPQQEGRVIIVIYSAWLITELIDTCAL